MEGIIITKQEIRFLTLTGQGGAQHAKPKSTELWITFLTLTGQGGAQHNGAQLLSVQDRF